MMITINEIINQGDLDKLKLLLRSTPELILGKNSEGETPLHTASKSGRQEVVELLLASGAKINAKDSFGNTPLHLASANGYKGVVELLLAKKAELFVRNQVNLTPFHAAKDKGHKDLAQSMYQHMIEELSRSLLFAKQTAAQMAETVQEAFAHGDFEKGYEVEREQKWWENRVKVIQDEIQSWMSDKNE